MKNSIDRKQFLKQFGMVGVAAVGASTLLSACGGGSESESATEVAAVDPCRDTSALTEQDLAMRNNLGYIEETEITDQQCINCQLFKKPENGGCGGCLLFNGPVTNEGWCNSWVINQG